MEVKVSDGFVQNKQTGNIKKESTNKSVYQQNNRQYLPPVFFQYKNLMRKVMKKPCLNRQKNGKNLNINLSTNKGRVQVKAQQREC